jgi:hypothetical protein
MQPGDVLRFFTVYNPGWQDRSDPAVDQGVYDFDPATREVKIDELLIECDSLDFQYYRFYHEKCI